MLEWSGNQMHESIIPIVHFKGNYELLRTVRALLKTDFCNMCLKPGKKNRHR